MAPAGRVQKGIEDRPVGYRVGPVQHTLRLAHRRGDRSGIHVVAADHNGSVELTAGHHFIERGADAIALTKTQPADARWQTLELDVCACLFEPIVQKLVLGDQLAHFCVGSIDVIRIAGQSAPSETVPCQRKTAAGHTLRRSPDSRRHWQRPPPAPWHGYCCRSRAQWRLSP